jgi:hypothetical protein
MKSFFYYFCLFGCLLSLTSCSAMLQGIAAGMSGYGGYGYGMYAPYAAAPMGYYPAAPSLPSQAQMQQQVEAMVLQLATSMEHSKEKTPLSKRLRGVVKAPKDFDYKVELANR